MSYGIRKMKTFYGLKWSVVDSEGHVVELSRDSGNRVAQYPLTKEGLEEARKVLKQFKK
jgi:hypothetical protein